MSAIQGKSVIHILKGRVDVHLLVGIEMSVLCLRTWVLEKCGSNVGWCIRKVFQ